jgi:plastocyanin
MKRSGTKLSIVSLMAVALLAIVVAGCGSSGSSEPEPSAKAQAPAPSTPASESAPATKQVAANVPPAHVKLIIKSDDEHGKKGPEGTWHDAFLPADFSVKAGQQVTVTVENYDEGAHSFTSTEMGVNKIIPAGTASKPQEATFTFTAPSKAGKYEWWCTMPCDPWAMTHKGFMRGEVSVS